MDAVKFFVERTRMCKSFNISEAGITVCEDCPSYHNGVCVVYDADGECSEGKLRQCVEIVEEWSKKHPRKTRLNDFLSKFPNAELSDGGYPSFPPISLGYCDAPSCFSCQHFGCKVPCWDFPVED